MWGSSRLSVRTIIDRSILQLKDGDKVSENIQMYFNVYTLIFADETDTCKELVWFEQTEHKSSNFGDNVTNLQGKFIISDFEI